MPTSSVSYLGIDIAKLKFDAALLSADNTPKHKTFPNTADGFESLQAWLRQNLVTDLHACLEATNTYHDALARFLVAQGHTVSVVNPAATRAFARAELARGKTDKADAARIARYCRAHQPRPWEPPAEAISVLQALVRRREALVQMHQVESQRLDESPEAVRPSIAAVLAVLNEQIEAVEKQIREHIDKHPNLKEQSTLLQSIPGIGATTAANLLCELGDISRFAGARQVAAFVGLAPRLRESGSSVRSRAVLCKMGTARLRKALYFPAISAIRHNPVLQEMSRRLTTAGKSKMSIMGAAMRRLVHLAFGVLKSGKPFDAAIPLKTSTQKA